jgi:hypothetical protein
MSYKDRQLLDMDEKGPLLAMGGSSKDIIGTVERRCRKVTDAVND